jgi:hypothetical protein
MHLLYLFQELGKAESLGTVALTGVFYEPCMNITAIITGRRKPKSSEKHALVLLLSPQIPHGMLCI